MFEGKSSKFLLIRANFVFFLIYSTIFFKLFRPCHVLISGNCQMLRFSAMKTSSSPIIEPVSKVVDMPRAMETPRSRHLTEAISMHCLISWMMLYFVEVSHSLLKKVNGIICCGKCRSTWVRASILSALHCRRFGLVDRFQDVYKYWVTSSSILGTW